MSQEQNETREQHIPRFLRELADYIEADTLSDEERQKVENFFEGYSSKNKPDPELMKYLFMGYYVYEILKTEEKEENKKSV